MAVTWYALNVLSRDQERSIYCSITQTTHMLTVHLLYLFFNESCFGTNICLFACQCHQPVTNLIQWQWTRNVFFFLKTRIFTYFNPEAQPTPPFTPDLRLCTTALNKLTSYQQDCQATTGSPLLRLSLPLRALLERDNFTAEGHSPQSLSRCCLEATILRNDLLW